MFSRTNGTLRLCLKRQAAMCRISPSAGVQPRLAAFGALGPARYNSSIPETPTPPSDMSSHLPRPDDIDAVVSASGGMEGTLNSLATTAVPELGYYPVDIAMYAIEQLHLFADIPYWQAIVCFTVGIRVMLLPIALRGVQNGNRMALLKPDMEKVQNAMKASEGMSDPKLQARYQMEMKELFKKHNVNPFRALSLPFMQMPIFISLFMALRQMQDYFPGYCEGGALWFTDLSVADPTYVLPVLNAFSFLLMVEVGADGMDQANKGMFKNVMRGLAVMMVPMTASMPQGLFVYWAANNVLSLAQSSVVKTQWMKNTLGLKELPKADSNTDAANPFKKFASAMSEYNEQMKAEKDGKVQFISGDSATVSAPPPPPPGVSVAKSSVVSTKSGAPPMTYNFNPKIMKKGPKK